MVQGHGEGLKLQPLVENLQQAGTGASLNTLFHNSCYDMSSTPSSANPSFHFAILTIFRCSLPGSTDASGFRDVDPLNPKAIPLIKYFIAKRIMTLLAVFHICNEVERNRL